MKLSKEEREERIALVSDGCNISQEEAEAVVKKWEAEQAKAEKKPVKGGKDAVSTH